MKWMRGFLIFGLVLTTQISTTDAFFGSFMGNISKGLKNAGNSIKKNVSHHMKKAKKAFSSFKSSVGCRSGKAKGPGGALYHIAAKGKLTDKHVVAVHHQKHDRHKKKSKGRRGRGIR